MNIGKTAVIGAMSLFAAGAQTSSAADWIYSGDSDLAVGTVGHEGDHIKFQTGGTYTLSRDVSLSQISFMNQNTRYVMDFRDGNHKVTLSQNLTIANGRMEIEFLGGTWDLSRYFFNFNKDGTVGAAWNDITFDGCIVTNAAVGQSCPVFVNAAENSVFRIVNGSKFYCDVTHKLEDNSTKYRNLVVFDNRNQSFGSDGRIATNQYFELSGGSCIKVRDFYLQNTFFDLGAADRGLFRNNRAVISGDGTLLDVQRISIGDGTSGNSLVISNGATLITKNIRGLPAENMYQTPVTVDGATVKIDSHLYLSDGSSGVDMTFTNGAVMQVGVSYPGQLDFYMTNSNNRLSFIDSTLKCARIELGKGGAANNVLSFSGGGSVLSMDLGVAASGALALFGTGSGNRLSLSGGATLDFWDTARAKAVEVKLNQSLGSGVGNVLETTGDGSRLSFKGKFYATNGVENVIRVSEGAEMVFADVFCLGGTNSELRVENGAARFTANTEAGGKEYAAVFVGGDVGYYGETIGRCMSSNATVVVSGDRPQLILEDTAIRFGNNSVLRFELPPKGYRTGVVPVVAGYFAEANRSGDPVRGVSIELEGLDELRANLSARTDIVLMRCLRGCADHGAVAEANAALPAGCSLFWQPEGESGKMLVLRAKPMPKGMVVVIK